MWHTFIDWETGAHLGDLASIISLVVGLVGFMVTISTAKRAERAALEASHRLKTFENIVDVSSGLVSLEEIRRFHRLGHWHLLPDRYVALRKILISIKGSNSALSRDQLTIVQQALATLQSIEKAVEKGIKEPDKLDGAKFNNLLSKNADGLQTALTELKTMQASVKHG